MSEDKKEKDVESPIEIIKTHLSSRAEYFRKISSELKKISLRIEKEEYNYMIDMFSGIVLQLSEIYNFLHLITEMIQLHSVSLDSISDRTFTLLDKDTESRETLLKVTEILSERIKEFDKYMPIMESGLRQLKKLDEER